MVAEATREQCSYRSGAQRDKAVAVSDGIFADVSRRAALRDADKVPTACSRRHS
jgi:hypothetical protein